jgi:hypothetical protein
MVETSIFIIPACTAIVVAMIAWLFYCGLAQNETAMPVISDVRSLLFWQV